MFFKPSTSSAVPVYVQLMEQVKHAVETGALRPGDQLPAIRRVAEDLVINPNTVARVYRELEHEGLIELRHGAGAFVADRGEDERGARLRKARPVVKGAVAKLDALGLAEEEMRRLFEAEVRELGEARASSAPSSPAAAQAARRK